MNIEIMSLKIYNFKGIKELDIDLQGKDCNIRGENATGKTTVKDAFTWLLFGKDSFGRSDFNIKPIDANGDVIHQLETSVEAVLNIDGTERSFKKTLNEVWTRRRGAAEATFTRNETLYYIQGVPKKKSEFTAEVAALIKEDIFKTVTDPLYFNEGMGWKERRAILIETCGNVTDEEVIASSAELAPLTSYLNGMEVDEFRTVLATAMKNINSELELIPVKINEAELAKPNLEELEIDHVRKDMLTQELEARQAEKGNIENGGHIAKEKTELRQLELELKNIGNSFVVETTDEYKNLVAVRQKLMEAQADRRPLVGLIFSFERRIADVEDARKELSADWDKIASERFTDSICPTCHRELPEDEVEARRKEFNVRKANKLDDLERRNDEYKAQLEFLQASLAEKQAEMTELDSIIAGLETDLVTTEMVVNTLIKEKVAEDDAEIEAITNKIELTKQKIAEYEQGSQGLIDEINVKIEKIQSELSDINEAIAAEAIVKKQDERIADLKKQQAYLASKYSENESKLYLTEKFITTKVDMLNERINEKFKYAKFKLFDKQINGGINEVCEVTYNGVPYKDLNNAMRINVGLDVINTISEHYGVIAPIIIDNAESVNQLFDTKAQQICMYVSNDKKLTFDFE